MDLTPEQRAEAERLYHILRQAAVPCVRSPPGYGSPLVGILPRLFQQPVCFPEPLAQGWQHLGRQLAFRPAPRPSRTTLRQVDPLLEVLDEQPQDRPVEGGTPQPGQAGLNPPPAVFLVGKHGDLVVQRERLQVLVERSLLNEDL